MKPHDCRQNWVASAKAMEGDMGVEMVKEVQGEDYQLSDLVNDGDSTLMANINQHVKDHTVNNWKDINHTTRSLTSCLYQQQKAHKKCLTKKVIAITMLLFVFCCCFF